MSAATGARAKFPRFLLLAVLFLALSQCCLSSDVEEPAVLDVDVEKLVEPKPEQVLSDESDNAQVEDTDARREKTILSKLPERVHAADKVFRDKAKVREGPKSEIAHRQVKDDGIRRFDAEIETDDEGRVEKSDGGTYEVGATVDDPSRAIEVLSIEEKNATEDESKHLNSDQGGEGSSLKLIESEQKGEEKEDRVRVLRNRYPESSGIVQRLREQALLLQEQIRNSSFMQGLREKMDSILPDIPQFTEAQMLETLEIINSVKPQIDYQKWNDSVELFDKLAATQQQIFNCAQRLVKEDQRQTFTGNMYNCIRGLNFMNCMRIFIYPILADNIPQSLTDAFPKFPIEINVADMIQGNRDKIALPRSKVDVVMAPEVKLYSVLKDMLKSFQGSDRISFFDPDNITLSALLNPNQINLLQTTESYIPDSSRQEYTDQMFACIQKYEYFSCIKYIAWPVLKQYIPMLPEFPNYYLTPKTPAQPEVIAYAVTRLNVNQVQEPLNTDGAIIERPRPETLILRTLQNSLKEHPRLPTLQPSILDLQKITINPELTDEQIASIRVAEQLLPVSLRPEYISKTISCVNEHDYFYCIKYSTWPTIRQFQSNVPRFPELQNWLSDYYNKFSNATVDKFPWLFPNISHWFGHQNPQGQGGSQGGTQGGSQGGGISGGVGGGVQVDPGQGGAGAGATPGYPVYPGPGQPPYYPPYPVIPVYPWFPQPPAGGGMPGQGSQDPTTGQGSGSAGGSGSGSTGGQEGTGSTDGQEATDKPVTTKPTEKPVTEASTTDDPDVTTDEPDVGDSASGGEETTDPDGPSYPCTCTALRSENYLKAAIAWENKVAVLLKRSNDLANDTSEFPTVFRFEKMPLYITLRQLDILFMAEKLMARNLPTREEIAMRFLDCLRKRDEFAGCMNDFIFPNLLKEFTPRFPKPPKVGLGRGTARADDQHSDEQEIQQNLPIHGDILKLKNTETPNVPVISVTDTRFIPLLTEHPETVIYNILRSIRYSSQSEDDSAQREFVRRPELIKVLSERQEKILRLAEDLVPEFNRKEFSEGVIRCSRNNVFITCARILMWPELARYHSNLPQFPNFGGLSASEENEPLMGSSLPKSSIYESRGKPSREGDATIATPETKLSPILERPEDLVMKILKAAQISAPYPSSQIPGISYVDSSDRIKLLSKEEADVLKTAESLLPASIRRIFVARMFDCVEKSFPFLDCMRDIAFPTINQFYPRLPSFPNFGSLHKLPLAVLKEELITDAERSLQSEIEKILQRSLYEQQDSRVPISPADAQIAFSSLLSDQQINIIKLSEKILPEALQLSYRTKMIECIRLENFLSCMERISWPTMKQFVPSLPEFPNPSFKQLLAQPGLQQIPLFPLNSLQLTQLSALPQLPQLPEGYALNNEFANHLPAVLDSRTYITFEPSRVFRRYSPPSSKAGASVGLTSAVTQHSRDGLLDDAPKQVRKRREVDNYTHSSTSEDNSDEDKEKLALRKLAEKLTLPDITESQLLGILIQISKMQKNQVPDLVDRREDLDDLLGPDLKANLTADQYEILKVVQNLNAETTKATPFMNRLVKCIQSLSFLRCVGIFVWPMIQSNLPTLPTLPSFPSLPISLPLPFIGRSTQDPEVHHYLELTSQQFKDNLSARKSDAEASLKQWYETLRRQKFNADLGPVKLQGHGNGELEVTFQGREKDAKNQKKAQTRYGRRKRSISKYSNHQLSTSDEDNAFVIFLNQFRTNFSSGFDDTNDVNASRYLFSKEAYEAFKVLFGTGLTSRIINEWKAANRGQDLMSENQSKIVPLQVQEENVDDALKVLPLNAEETRENDERRMEENARRNKKRKLGGRELTFRLPDLDENILDGKGTDILSRLNRKVKTSGMNLAPFGMVMSFFLQMVLAHLRTAASVAGMMSNMAMGTAMFGLLRQSLFGSSQNPQIKYVYDNADTGPGVTWARDRK